MFNTPYSNNVVAEDTYATNNGNWGQEEPEVVNNDDFNFVADPTPNISHEEVYYGNQT